MKIELEKSIKYNGEVWYYIVMDGFYSDCTKDLEEAYRKYETAKNNATEPKREILKSETI